jgi:hypothetical protein
MRVYADDAGASVREPRPIHTGLIRHQEESVMGVEFLADTLPLRVFVRGSSLLVSTFAATLVLDPLAGSAS